MLAARLALAESRVQPGALGEVRSAIESVLAWPAFHPPVVSAQGGSDGSVWLRRDGG